MIHKIVYSYVQFLFSGVACSTLLTDKETTQGLITNIEITPCSCEMPCGKQGICNNLRVFGTEPMRAGLTSAQSARTCIGMRPGVCT